MTCSETDVHEKTRSKNNPAIVHVSALGKNENGVSERKRKTNRKIKRRKFSSGEELLVGGWNSCNVRRHAHGRDKLAVMAPA